MWLARGQSENPSFLFAVFFLSRDKLRIVSHQILIVKVISKNVYTVKYRRKKKDNLLSGKCSNKK